jgi:hypothetical protein
VARFNLQTLLQYLVASIVVHTDCPCLTTPQAEVAPAGEMDNTAAAAAACKASHFLQLVRLSDTLSSAMWIIQLSDQ